MRFGKVVLFALIGLAGAVFAGGNGIEVTGIKFYHKGTPHYFQMTSPTEYELNVSCTEDTGAVDIVFVLDTTGSMSSSIDEAVAHIVEFAETMAATGYDYSFGIVTYGDGWNFPHGYDLTTSADTFVAWMGPIGSTGGGDTPEDALDAIARSLSLSWRAGVQHIVILITDAPYHQEDTRTDLNTDDVIVMLDDESATCFVVGYDNDDEHRLAEETGGVWFPIGSDFTDIIGRIADILSAQYIITYTTHNPIPDNRWRNVLVTVETDTFTDSDDGRYWVGEAGLYFDPETTYTRNGLHFSVDVMAASITDLYDVHFLVNFDGAKVTLDSTVSGELLARDADSPLEVITPKQAMLTYR